MNKELAGVVVETLKEKEKDDEQIIAQQNLIDFMEKEIDKYEKVLDILFSKYVQYIPLDNEELKILEEMQEDRKSTFIDNLEEYKKQDEVLRIIKEKQVDIHILLESKTCEQYNKHTHWLGYEGNLNENEFDLLKEVLL